MLAIWIASDPLLDFFYIISHTALENNFPAAKIGTMFIIMFKSFCQIVSVASREIGLFLNRLVEQFYIFPIALSSGVQSFQAILFFARLHKILDNFGIRLAPV